MRLDALVAICTASALAACATRPPGMGSGGLEQLMRTNGASVAGVGSIDALMARQGLMQELMTNPDLPAWHAQREQMSLAIGDRQFDKPFDRVFDSMTVALASLGCRVQNMERVSGYITASLPEMPPEQTAALRQQMITQYAVAKGYPPSIVDPNDPTTRAFGIDPGAMMERGMAGLTISMVRQGDTQTKVKLRFDNVYYPKRIEELYKLVWAAVDKQMFLDKALD